jgi:hypothetical protein
MFLKVAIIAATARVRSALAGRGAGLRRGPGAASGFVGWAVVPRRRDWKQPHHGGALSRDGTTVGRGPDFLRALASRWVALFGQAAKAIAVQ